MERETLKSRLGFILLSAGCAIGIGNCGENGNSGFYREAEYFSWKTF